jgi:hypothetical protein
MTKKFHILLIILTLGFFATPTLTYACGTKSYKTKNSCCKKDKSDKTDKKDCCKNYKSKNGKNDGDCGGKCNHKSCSCPTTNYAYSLPFWTEIKVKIYITESEKIKNYYNENYLSDGFVSIWTPPNIG